MYGLRVTVLSAVYCLLQNRKKVRLHNAACRQPHFPIRKTSNVEMENGTGVGAQSRRPMETSHFPSPPCSLRHYWCPCVFNWGKGGGGTVSFSLCSMQRKESNRYHRTAPFSVLNASISYGLEGMFAGHSE